MPFHVYAANGEIHPGHKTGFCVMRAVRTPPKYLLETAEITR